MKTDKVYDIWEQLENTSSTKQKQAILEENKDNGTLKKWLYYTYNPYYNYGILSLPDECWNENKTANKYVGCVNEKFFELLDNLRNRIFTGNLAKEKIIYFCQRVDEETVSCLSATLGRTLDCGVSVATINKVWKNLIPEFNIAKANPLDSENQITKYPVQVEQKMNGVRVIIMNDEDTIHIFSSNGNEVPQERLMNLRKSVQILARNSGYDSFVLDGELVSKNRKTVSGVFNKALKDTLTTAEEFDAELIYTVFDLLSVKAWQSQESDTPLSTRLKQMAILLSDKNLLGTDIVRVTSVAANDYKAITAMYKDIIQSGGEGVIVKDLNAPYSFTRSDDWLKVKNISEADLRIVGFTKGTGKRTNTIGAIVVESKDRKIQVSVGSGLTDSDLEYFSKHQDKLVGRIITVAYNEIITDKDGNYSLFLPRFIELRNDKTEADSFDKIKRESNGSEL